MDPYYELEIEGGVALVDAADFDKVRSFEWFVNGKGYAVSVKSEGWYSMHRFLTGAPCEWIVDHANRDPLDNRRTNLRRATYSQNNANRHVENSTGFRGVRCIRGRKWQARLGEDRRYLGTFATPEEAARAYDRAAHETWGEFAVLNFPEEYGLDNAQVGQL